MLNFTRQERVVVYFLVITLGLGAIVRFIRNRNLDAELTPTRFYQEEERFKEVANALNDGSSEIIDSLIVLAEDGSEETLSPVDSSRGLDLININQATLEELTSLPGIGPALAQRIKAYTDQNGPFKHKADIVLIKGIGPKLYARIEGLVTTE